MEDPRLGRKYNTGNNVVRLTDTGRCIRYFWSGWSDFIESRFISTLLQVGRNHKKKSPMRGKSFRLSFISICASSRAMSTSSSNKPKIAAIAQLRSTSNKFQNLLDIAKCARMAKDHGACMLFLPECFGFMGESSVQTLEQAEYPILEDTNVNDEALTAQLVSAISGHSREELEPGEFHRIFLLDGLRTIAKECGLWISGGGMHVSGAPPDPESGNQRVYNTHLILDDRGQVKAIYRKTHLFDVSIPGQVELRESATTAPGNELVVCESPLGSYLFFYSRYEKDTLLIDFFIA